MNIEVFHIDNEDDLKKSFRIREAVYIEEQKIDRADEFDEFDSSSHHFLALANGIPAGTCRWRLTEEGCKLERFATLSEFRKKGVAGKMMEAMIDHISSRAANVRRLYLNAQVNAMPLYTKYGFREEGERFLECGIEHQKMTRTL